MFNFIYINISANLCHSQHLNPVPSHYLKDECCPLILGNSLCCCVARSQCLFCTVAAAATRSFKREEEHVSTWMKRRQNGYEDNHVSGHSLSVMTTLSVEIHRKAVGGHDRVITSLRSVNVSGVQASVWRCGLVSKIAYREIGLMIARWRDRFATSVV